MAQKNVILHFKFISSICYSITAHPVMHPNVVRMANMDHISDSEMRKIVDFGLIFGTFWATFGHVLDILGLFWANLGLILGRVWSILGTFRAHFDHISHSLWAHSGHILCLFWAHFGHILDPYGTFMPLLGPFQLLKYHRHTQRPSFPHQTRNTC